MKTSTVFWSLVVNSLLFLMFRHCYYNEENFHYHPFFIILVFHWCIGIVFIGVQYEKYENTGEVSKTMLNGTFFLTSLITLGAFFLICLTIYGIYKGIIEINKLLDS